MKRKIVTFVLGLILLSSFFMAGCFDSVVPAAWVYLKMDGGYVEYTNDMYAQHGSHIYCFESRSDSADESNYLMEIIFTPRILGPDEVEVDGQNINTTIVDISNYVDMTIYIKLDSPICSPEKEIYINGEKVTATSTETLSTIKAILIQNVEFVRGNPEGHFNGKINVIEYK